MTIRLRIIVLFWILIGIHFIPSSHAGTISVFFLPPNETDSASGIDSRNHYLCALAFGGRTNSNIINGVPFQRVHLNGQETGSGADMLKFSGVDLNHGGTWSITEQSQGKCGFIDSNFDTLNGQADGAMGSLLSSGSSAIDPGMYLPSDRTVTLDLGGLRPGKKYSLRYYYCQRAENPMINFSFCGESKEEHFTGNLLNLSAGGAAYIRYDFIAATTHVTMRMKVNELGNILCFSAVTMQTLPEDAILSVAPFVPQLDPKYGMGSWIWGAETHDEQKYRFWKSFVIPDSSSVNFARLRITGDNYYRIMLDGRVIGEGNDWRILTEYDLHMVLNSGRHIIAVEGANEFAYAGVNLGLFIQLSDGQILEVGSDSTWKIAPNDDLDWATRSKAPSSWQPATIIAAPDSSPWLVGNLWPIYMGPTPKKIAVHFWDRVWFKIMVVSILFLSLSASFYLKVRLVLQSKEHFVVQRERARIARDIHDDLSAGITQLIVFAESEKNDLNANSKAHRSLDTITSKARHLAVTLRETIWVVNSQRDSLQDLAMFLCDYTENYLKTTSIKCRFDITSDLPTLTCHMGIRRNLLLAVKEGLCNAVKYSAATELNLRIFQKRNEIVVRIEDNGKGFDLALIKNDRNGLTNMKQRAKDAGGTCDIVSKPGAGCQVEFRVPVSHLRRFRLWGPRRMEIHSGS